MVTSIGATTKRSKLLKKAASCRSRNPPWYPPDARPVALLALPIRQPACPLRTRHYVLPQGRRVASSLTVGLFLGGHGELVGPVVAGLVWTPGLLVPLDLLPSYFPVAQRRLQEPLPQVPVRHGLSAVVEPSILPPRLVPAPPHAIDEVGRVGVDGHDVPLAAADLLGLASPGQDYPVASGAAGATRCPVGVGVGL